LCFVSAKLMNYIKIPIEGLEFSEN
jgi:hypothetical protein